MIETLSELFKGSATIIKNKEFYSAKTYIEPFIDLMKPYNAEFVCHVKRADQIAYDDDKVYTVYNRVLVISKFPSQYDINVNRNGNINTYKRVMCMAYALDVKTPICKFYTGVIDSDDNFYTFGANCINIQKIEAETLLNYSYVNTVLSAGLNDNCEFMLTQNLTIGINKSELTNSLGEWIDFSIKKEYINDSGKVKLANNIPIEAYKRLVVDKDSDYYLDDDVIQYPEIFKAFLSQITEDDKDITNRYEKTCLINNLLKL